jgi:hypothetical protein
MEFLKACLFNLIVITKDFTLAKQQVNALTKKYPCKVIFITIDPTSKESFLKRGSEPFLIEASSDQIHKIPFLVVPELSSDFPSFLFAENSIFESPLITALEQYVERIFFKAHPSHIGSFASSLLTLPYASKCVDLNWVKTKPWRQAFYSVFSNKEKVSHLKSSTTIHISFCNGSSGANFQSMLLQAWIASCMSWKLLSGANFTFTYSHNERTYVVILKPVENSILEEGSIVSVEFFGDTDIHYLLSYGRDDRHITVSASTEAFCEVPYTLFVDSYQKGKALANEILQQQSAEHYFPTLKLLTTL